MQATRGKLLFQFAARQPIQVPLWMWIAIMTPAVGITLYVCYANGLLNVNATVDWVIGATIAAVLGLTVLSVRTSPKVRFYENGVQFPKSDGDRDSVDGQPSKFIAWKAIERFYWDDDLLTVVPRGAPTAFLSLSGASGDPTGDPRRVRVPAGPARTDGAAAFASAERQSLIRGLRHARAPVSA